MGQVSQACGHLRVINFEWAAYKSGKLGQRIDEKCGPPGLSVKSACLRYDSYSYTASV